MTACPKCGNIDVKREVENVYEIDDTKYFDIRLICDRCGLSKPVTMSRKNPVPKARDEVTEMVASLKLRPYLPERKEAPLQKSSEAIEPKRKVSPSTHAREVLLYGGAVLLGLGVEIAGLYFESYLGNVRIHPLAGFLMSLLIFVFGPLLIVGSVVYYVTKDRLKAVLLGSIAVPLTIVLLAKLRLGTWGV